MCVEKNMVCCIVIANLLFVHIKSSKCFFPAHFTLTKGPQKALFLITLKIPTSYNSATTKVMDNSATCYIKENIQYVITFIA